MKTVVVDANNAMHRLFHKMPFLTTSSGQPIQLVYGFLKLLRGVLNDYQPNSAVVCWDVGFPRLRMEMWPEYKQNRILKKTNPDLKQKQFLSAFQSQSTMLKELLPTLGVTTLGIDGLEADDMIALACQALPGKRIIVSSDTDMYQLVRKGVSIFAPQQNKYYHHKNFQKRLGLTPRQYFECKVLAGDGSDGIPGIAPGFGEKTAKDLILRYGNLEALLTARKSNMESFGKNVTRERLIFQDGVDEIIKRNLQLMDLSLMSSKTASKLILNKVLSPKQVDIFEVRKYLQQKEFVSLLEDFLGWVGPFKRLARR